MKTITAIFIILFLLSCKPTLINHSQITGKYKHGYVYQLNDYGLAHHDSIFIDLNDDRTFNYQHIFYRPGIRVVEENSFGKWQLKNNNLILNSEDNFIKTKIDTVSVSTSLQVPKLHFKYDFFDYISPKESYETDKENLDEAFKIRLCENLGNCYNLKKSDDLNSKLSNEESNDKRRLIYDYTLDIDTLITDKLYYVEINIRKNRLSKYAAYINAQSIKSNKFKIKEKNILTKVKIFLKEEDLLFYSFNNKKIRINKKNELIFDRKKLKKIEDD
jgi:hypothetical protein